MTQYINFSSEEYQANLKRLGIEKHDDLVGKDVYYSRKVYGRHKVMKWDAVRHEYLLNLEGQTFWSCPLRIHIIKNFNND